MKIRVEYLGYKNLDAFLFEICKKIEVCYIPLQILKYTKKTKCVTYKLEFQCVCHVDWDWGSCEPLEKYLQETGLWKEDRVQQLQKKINGKV
jgi:hypothetical protein